MLLFAMKLIEYSKKRLVSIVKTTKTELSYSELKGWNAFK